MQTETIAQKLREYIQDFRAQLDKGDVSSVPALTENTGTFFRELIRELPEGSAIGLEVETFAACVEVFGTACRQADMETAARTLNEMEDVLDAVNAQCHAI